MTEQFGLAREGDARVPLARAGRRAAKLHRDTAVMALGSQLDRRLGVELRTVMRDRAELMGLLTELSIEAAKLEAAVPTV